MCLFTNSLAFVTGASRGIGKETSLQLAKNMCPKTSILVLHASTVDKLCDVSSLVSEIAPTLRVKKYGQNLQDKVDPEELRQFLRQIMLESKVTSAAVFHNAATLGDVSMLTCETFDECYISSYMHLNFTTFVQFNSAFVSEALRCSLSKICVVNITSLAAVQGMASMGLYAAGKSARESFLRVLAAERPSLRILNYSPGPVNTDMLQELMCNTWSDTVRDIVLEEVPIDRTVAKMLSIIQSDSYANAAHIDYYDERFTKADSVEEDVLIDEN